MGGGKIHNEALRYSIFWKLWIFYCTFIQLSYLFALRQRILVSLSHFRDTRLSPSCYCKFCLGLIDFDTSCSRSSPSVLYLAHPHFKWLYRVITLVLLQQIMKQLRLLVFLVRRRNGPRYPPAVMLGWSKSRFLFIFIWIKEIKKKISES